MSQNIQYITNESGAQVGVLLDLATYRHLISREQDPDLLIGLSTEELLALSDTSLAPDAQVRLDSLLLQNQESQLSASEQQELDGLLTKIDNINLLKTRARYTLTQLNSKAS